MIFSTSSEADIGSSTQRNTSFQSAFLRCSSEEQAEGRRRHFQVRETKKKKEIQLTVKYQYLYMRSQRIKYP